MQKLIIHILYTFLGITALTALVTIAGLIWVWFFEGNCDELPYLGYLITAIVIELAGITFFVAKKGLSFLPKIVTNKTKDETKDFLEKFISSGSSASIYSSRVSWLIGNEALLKVLREKIEDGLKVEIITSGEINSDIRANLSKAHFYVTNEESPFARFTLINGERSGSERLAIAKGSHPNHEITIFDNNSGPQIIGMAKDLIKKSKALSDEK